MSSVSYYVEQPLSQASRPKFDRTLRSVRFGIGSELLQFGNDMEAVCPARNAHVAQHVIVHERQHLAGDALLQKTLLVLLKFATLQPLLHLRFGPCFEVGCSQSCHNIID